MTDTKTGRASLKEKMERARRRERRIRAQWKQQQHQFSHNLATVYLRLAAEQGNVEDYLRNQLFPRLDRDTCDDLNERLAEMKTLIRKERDQQAARAAASGPPDAG